MNINIPTGYFGRIRLHRHWIEEREAVELIYPIDMYIYIVYTTRNPNLVITVHAVTTLSQSTVMAEKLDKISCMSHSILKKLQ